MSRFRLNRTFATGLALSILALPILALALSASEILKSMDDNFTRFTDSTMESTMTIYGVDGSSKSYDMIVYQKGTNKRLVRFTSGEEKGMTVLSDGEKVYVYMPKEKKIRPVAGHTMNQTFAGSDFTSADMATVSWSQDWDPTLEREDDRSYYLRCAPKPGRSPGYDAVVLKIDRATFRQDGVEYYQGGSKIKEMTTSDPTDMGGFVMNKRITMTDIATGHRTEILVRSFKVNQGLKDSMFTQRELMWGR